MGFGLAALVVTLTGLSEETRPVAGETREFDAAALVLLVLAGALLLVRNRFPGTVVIGVLALSFLWYFNGYTSGLINVPTLVAFYSLGTTGDRRRQLGIGVVALVVTPVVMFAFSNEPSGEALDAVGYPLAALLLGELVRGRRLLRHAHASEASVHIDRRPSALTVRVADNGSTRPMPPWRPVRTGSGCAACASASSPSAAPCTSAASRRGAGKSWHRCRYGD